MKNYALVQNGLVVNIVVWDGVEEFNPPGDQVIPVPDGAFVDIGYKYDGNSFSAQ